MNKSQASQLHEKLRGKIEVQGKMSIVSMQDLSLVYTPGVAEVCQEIAADVGRVYDLTMKNDTIAIVTDGSAVLGLGNIGPEAALPVMEGKAMIFKEFAGINAVPICLRTQDSREIIDIVKNIAPGFGGINLEDIAAPRCFEIEEALQEIGIPVFHDDQHGTAIVLLAALLNAVKLAEKDFTELKVVISGAGAAGTAIAKLLLGVGYDREVYPAVQDVIVCDSKGILFRGREDLDRNPAKMELANLTNKDNIKGSLKDALVNADVFVGVSQGNIVAKEMVRSMRPRPIIFALANPIPEIDPQSAKEAGAFIVGTGRSDYPNQVNNALVFPGLFRGALDARSPQITKEMKMATAHALAESVEDLSPEKILPDMMEKAVFTHVAEVVKTTCLRANASPESLTAV